MKIENNILKISNRFKTGYDAEAFIIESYFPLLNLSFNKIPEGTITTSTGTSKTPEGFLLRNSKKIALVEIKMIQRRFEGVDTDTFEILKTDDAIRRQVKKAKIQLCENDINFPKIVVLVMNDLLDDSDTVHCGLFGKYETLFVGNKKQFEGYRGSVNENNDENLFSDNLLSGVIVYIPQKIDIDGKFVESYETLIYTNEITNNFPKEIFKDSHILEHWKYNKDNGKLYIKLAQGNLNP